MIKKILVAQPTSVASNPQYVNLSNKYSVVMTFTKFFNIEPISVRDFRGQNINIPDYSAIVFSSKATIDAFFGICKQVKVRMPDDQKYFCTTEAVALYLQKHIVDRKRKIFFGDGSFRSVARLACLEKHKRERFLIVTPDQQNPELIRLFKDAGLTFSTSVMARFVGANLKYLNLNDYQLICCYNAEDVKSLLANFPKFKQGSIKFIAFGAGTRKAMKENGLKTFIEGPTAELPSLTSALETILKNPNYQQTIFPPEPVVTAVTKTDVAKKSVVKAPAKREEVKKAAVKASAKKDTKKTAATAKSKTAATKKITTKAPAKKNTKKVVVKAKGKTAVTKKAAVKAPTKKNAKKTAVTAKSKTVATKKTAVKAPAKKNVKKTVVTTKSKVAATKKTTIRATSKVSASKNVSAKKKQVSKKKAAKKK